MILTGLIGYFYSVNQFQKGIELGKNQQIAIQSEVDDKMEKLNEQNQLFLAKQISEIKVQNKTIYQKATKEVTYEKVYSDCVLPDSGVRNANEALRARN